MVVETPKKYSEFLERIGGRNLYNEANFILQWGDSPIRRYAVPDDLLGPYLNCWCLAEWTAPEELGTPDELEALGIPYPIRGAYLPFQTYKNGNEPIMLDTEQLNLNVLEKTVHVIMKHKHDTLQRRYFFMKNEYDRIEADKRKALIDRIEDTAPAFIGASTGYGSVSCNGVVQKKIELLEKNLDRITNVAKRFPRRGLVQRSA